MAGIKFSDFGYQPNPEVCNNTAELHYFSTDISAFIQWVEAAGPGGTTEYQLDILMCAKEMAPTALLYIALATDEDSDSSLNMLAVADALTESGSIVFIDPASGDLVPYYQPLAVNGGAIEQESETWAHSRFRT